MRRPSSTPARGAHQPAPGRRARGPVAAPPGRAARAVWAVLAAGWALLVWGLLTTPAPPAMPATWLPAAVQPWQDKIGHVGLFFVQAGLLQRALRERLGVGRAFVLAATLA